MSTIKNLNILIFFLGVLYSSVDDSIRQNEVVIEALQKQLDSMQSKGEEEAVKALQSHIDSVIEQQNKLLQQKATGKPTENLVNDGNSEVKIRQIIREELLKSGIVPKASNPYDTSHTPTAAELDATKIAETNAPELPEKQSEAIAQYELALKLYNRGEYKQAAAGFGRIIKTYPNDPIKAKALIHLAYCLEKQGNIEEASVVCDVALQEKLDDTHLIDCQLMRLKFAKNKENDADIKKILNSLKGIPLTAEQQQTLNEIQGKKTEVTTTNPTKASQPKMPADAHIAKAPSTPEVPVPPPPAIAR